MFTRFWPRRQKKREMEERKGFYEEIRDFFTRFARGNSRSRQWIFPRAEKYSEFDFGPHFHTKDGQKIGKQRPREIDKEILDH